MALTLTHDSIPSPGAAGRVRTLTAAPGLTPAPQHWFARSQSTSDRSPASFAASTGSGSS